MPGSGTVLLLVLDPADDVVDTFTLPDVQHLGQ